MGTASLSLIACFAGLHFFTGMLLFCFKAFSAVIEEIYGLSGTMTGLMVSCPDIGYLLSIVPVAFLATKFSRPRLMGLGCILMASGTGIFCMPSRLCRGIANRSFSLQDNADGYLCGSNATGVATPLPELNSTIKIRHIMVETECAAFEALIWLLSGALLVGVGAGSATTLHFSYIDDNTERSKSPVYLGIIQASSLLGVFSSYFLAGALTKKDAGEKQYVEGDDRGRHGFGWWLAFVFASVGCIFSSLRFWCIRDPDRQEDLNYEAHYETDGDGSFSFDSSDCQSLETGEKVIPQTGGLAESIKRLSTDRWLLSTLLAAACWHFPPIFNGTFILQYLHLQFDISLSSSSFLVGLTTGIPALVGIPAGGLLVSRYSMQVKDLCNYIIILAIIASFTIPVGCPSDENLLDLAKGLGPGCARSCGCTGSQDPFFICCSDGLSYVSPCHAGCKGIRNSTETVGTFVDCECVPESATRRFCLPGVCKRTCGAWKIGTFLLVLVMKVFLGCLCYIPFGMLLMRSVHPSDKALIVALKELSGKFLGDAGGSVAMGRLFDSACILYSKTDDHKCSLYDLESLKISYFLINLLPLVCVVAIVSLARRRLSRKRWRDG